MNSYDRSEQNLCHTDASIIQGKAASAAEGNCPLNHPPSHLDFLLLPLSEKPIETLMQYYVDI
jgi:hypothetical protein